MEITYVPRASGKTTKAIKKAHETDSYIVTATLVDCQRIFCYAKDLDIDIRYPITWHELMRTDRRTGLVHNLVIDDIDRILTHFLCHHKINLITLTKEKK